jgi:ribosomal protein S18 acetylase RimI-like enzyme
METHQVKGNPDLRVQIGLEEQLLTEIASLYDEAFKGKFKWAIASQLKRVRLWSQIIDPKHVIGIFREEQLLGILLYSTPNNSGWKDVGIIRRIWALLPSKEAIKILFIFGLLEKRLPKNLLYIEAIAVSDEARGMGIGTQLLTVAESVARGSGFEGLELRVIQENYRARLLYEREGFRMTGTENTGFIYPLVGFKSAHKMEKRFDPSSDN